MRVQLEVPLLKSLAYYWLWKARERMRIFNELEKRAKGVNWRH